jgi:hypothetical protein
MAGRRSEGDRACCGEQADVTCAGLTVRRLSEERVHELAEEIWRASTGRPAPPRSQLDPRRSQPGASAQAAYLRRRQEDRASWRRGWRWRTGIGAAATLGCGLLIGITLDAGLGWRVAVLVALLAGWLLRFRPSARARLWRGHRHAAPHGLCATAPRAGELPGAARHHPARMASQHRPPGGRRDRYLGHRVLAARPTENPTHGHIAAACVPRQGWRGTQVALAGGGPRRHSGGRPIDTRPTAALCPPAKVAEKSPAGRRRHSSHPAATERPAPPSTVPTAQRRRASHRLAAPDTPPGCLRVATQKGYGMTVARLGCLSG